MTAQQLAKLGMILANLDKFAPQQREEIEILKVDFANHPLWPGWVEILDEFLAVAKGETSPQARCK